MTFYSSKSTDVYAHAGISEWMVPLSSVWPLLLNFEIFAGSGFNSAEIQMQTEEEMTQQVSLVGMKKNSNANKIDLLSRF